MDRISEELKGILQARLESFAGRKGMVEQELLRVRAAQDYLAAGSGAWKNPDTPRAVDRLRLALEQFLFASVEIDELMYPQTDPNLGWVRWGAFAPTDTPIAAANPGLFPVETQLQRLVFTQDGSLVSLAYKPRKADLHSVVSETEVSAATWRAPSLAFSDSRNPAIAKCSEDPELLNGPAPHIIRDSKVGVEVRFEQWCGPGTRIFKQYSIQAGIGAHLNYSTTGFKCELWSEGEVAELVHLEINLLMPQATNHGFLVAPLESFGGVGKSVDNPGSIPFFAAQGFWGVQITDAINDFLVQYRFSRPLSGGSFQHLYRNSEDEDTYCGTRIVLDVEGKLLADSLRPLTLFFSIL